MGRCACKTRLSCLYDPRHGGSHDQRLRQPTAWVAPAPGHDVKASRSRRSMLSAPTHPATRRCSEPQARSHPTRRGSTSWKGLRGRQRPTSDLPAPIASGERDRLTAEEATRLVRILKAGWALFDRVVAAPPAAVCKGPRGGGCDRDLIVEHRARLLSINHLCDRCTRGVSSRSRRRA
jgi:hypothetical protein